mmetsp:Transcript_6601/g.15791  ORF Transcript_6601/g.15791 Transcript_6601/m.15791 type:complete len:239 (-) Transcript_6601:80-796(-)
MHRYHRVLLPQHAGANTAELLHVGTNAENQPHVDTHGSHVGSRLARNPDSSQALLGIPIKQFTFVGRSHAQLSLHGRRNRRALEACTGEHFHGPQQLGLAVNWSVKPADSYVLLTRALLGFDQPRRSVNAHQQIPGHFRIQCSAVSSLLTLQNALDPRHNLMGRRVARLVQVDHTILEILVQFSVKRRRSIRHRREMSRAYVQLVIVLQQQRPVRRVNGLVLLGRLNGDILFNQLSFL